VLFSINDITQRKEAEGQLEEINRTLKKRVEAETDRRLAHEHLLADQLRFAAVGKMIGIIAHQWRQPLSTLALAIQRMHAIGRRQELSRGQWDEFKLDAMGHIRHMSDTIDEFLHFYLPGKQRTPFQPCLCIADTARLLDALLKASKIKVVLNCSEDVNRTAFGYPNEFKQVVLNLLGNSRDAIMARRSAQGQPEEGCIVFGCIHLRERHFD